MKHTARVLKLSKKTSKEVKVMKVSLVQNTKIPMGKAFRLRNRKAFPRGWTIGYRFASRNLPKYTEKASLLSST